MLSSAQGTTLASQTGALSAVLDGVSIDNNGILISSAGNPSGSLASQSGSVHLIAMNMGMNGDVVADADSTADLFLFNTDWTGKSSNGTNFKFDTTSQWNITDNSDVATLLNVGSIRFTGNSVGRTLTVHDQYLGDGGTLLLNTVLGDDNSLTDRLVIEGDSLGNTWLHINNVGGTGAQTVVNGIQVVQVGGESTGQFTLDGRVVAGLYDYQLFQGGGR
ncbi:hypothetical protein B4907_22095 [Yersinia kristensenii]|nr:hypothetical protein B4907_22095 [Yersinia kristensenii]